MGIASTKHHCIRPLEIDPLPHVREPWDEKVSQWQREHPLSASFLDAEKNLLSKKIPLAEAVHFQDIRTKREEFSQSFKRLGDLVPKVVKQAIPSFAGQHPVEAHTGPCVAVKEGTADMTQLVQLVEPLRQLESSLEPGQPLSTKSAWALWPLLKSQSSEQRERVCRLLNEHHRDVRVRCYNGSEVVMSSVVLGMKHPVIFPHFLKPMRKESGNVVEIPSISSIGLQALCEAWEGKPLRQILTEGLAEKGICDVFRAADFFGCDELLDPFFLVKDLASVYGLDKSKLFYGIFGKGVQLHADLESDDEVNKIESVLQILSAAKIETHCYFRQRQNDKTFPERLASFLSRIQGLMFSSLQVRGAVDAPVALALAKVVTSSVCLKALDLADVRMGGKEVATLLTAVKTAPTLKKLDLSGTNLGLKEANLIAECLSTNVTLRSLDLGSNRLGSRGAEAIARVLKDNIGLRKLVLTGNGIGQTGAQALSRALDQNTVITTVDLRDNRLGARAAHVLHRKRSIGCLSLDRRWSFPCERALV